MKLLPALLLPLLSIVACHTDRPPPTFPPLPKGCVVEVYRGPLPSQLRVDTIGEVSSTCNRNDAESDCLRALQDEVCGLGGDIVYRVPAALEESSDGSLHYTGAAARKRVQDTTEGTSR